MNDCHSFYHMIVFFVILNNKNTGKKIVLLSGIRHLSLSIIAFGSPVYFAQ